MTALVHEQLSLLRNMLRIHLQVLNICVVFPVQPAGVRFLQSQVLCILAEHLGKQQTVAKWIYTYLNINLRSVQHMVR
jgi:tRNA-binding EMAP/Myf-like protein